MALRFPIRNKKAVEEPQTIVYFIYIIVLTALGIYIAYMFMGNFCLTLEFTDFNARYNAAASRFLNTPDCFALEEEYITLDGVKMKQVSAGVLDFSKMSGDKITEKCISGEKPIYLRLEYNIDQDIPNIKELWTVGKPGKDELKDETKWNQHTWTYFVLVSDGSGKLKPGKMQFWIKDTEKEIKSKC